MVGAMGPTLHLVVAKHLLGIELESKKKKSEFFNYPLFFWHLQERVLE
jgi:hypothetical protein